MDKYIFVKVLEGYTNHSITQKQITDWANNQLHENLKKNIYDIDFLILYPLLSKITNIEYGSKFSEQDANEILLILRGIKKYRKFFFIKIEYKFESRIDFLEKVWNDFKKEQYQPDESYSKLELLKEENETKTIVDLIINTLISLLEGLPCVKNGEMEFTSFNEYSPSFEINIINKIDNLFLMCKGIREIGIHCEFLNGYTIMNII